jgi:hypothetical protein
MPVNHQLLQVETLVHHGKDLPQAQHLHSPLDRVNKNQVMDKRRRKRRVQKDGDHRTLNDEPLL